MYQIGSPMFDDGFFKIFVESLTVEQATIAKIIFSSKGCSDWWKFIFDQRSISCTLHGIPKPKIQVLNGIYGCNSCQV